MQVKMTSQQNALIHAGDASANFNYTDDSSSRCAQLNANTLAWAVAAAGPRTAQRYLAKGMPIVMGPDQDTIIGPIFTYGSLNYTFINATESGTNKPYVSLEAITLRTPVDFWLPISAGFHYCHMLSPARAMEWVYIDSLRSFLMD